MPFVVTNNPTFTWGFQVPNLPSLVGVNFYNQAFVVDPGVNTLGVATSNAGEGTFLRNQLSFVEEDFATNRQFDPRTSSGSWGGNWASPGLIGGSGVLGEFDVRDGVEVSPGVFEWNTNNQVIPGSRTLTGQNIAVTDGVFQFSHFHLKAGETLVFRGTNPARFVVRGSVLIEGSIQANGPDVAPFFRATSPSGQPGGLGAIGGGMGGAGGDAGNGVQNLPHFQRSGRRDAAAPGRPRLRLPRRRHGRPRVAPVPVRWPLAEHHLQRRVQLLLRADRGGWRRRWRVGARDVR